MFWRTNRIIIADFRAGADVGAKIQRADSDLGSSKGQIWVFGSGTVTENPVKIGPNHDLVCVGNHAILTFAGAAWVQQSSNTRIKNCTILSAQTSIPNVGHAEIYAAGVSNVEVDNVSFSGGGGHVFYNAVTNATIRHTHHTGEITVKGAIAQPIAVSELGGASSHVRIIEPQISEVIFGASDFQNNAIGVTGSYIDVINPLIRKNDASTVSTSGGIAFSGCSHCNLVGGRITDNVNMDGLLIQGNGAANAPSVDITASRFVSTGNSNTGGIGKNYGTGDGIDIFNAEHVRISSCIARNNGNYALNRHNSADIYEASDIVISDCDLSNSGQLGVQIVGGLRTKLIANQINENGSAGVVAQPQTQIVNTNGTAVTYISGGNGFGIGWPANTDIEINNVVYAIASITDSNHLTLRTPAGVQKGVTSSVESTELQILRSNINNNGQRQLGPQNQEGIVLTGGSSAYVEGVTALDTRATQAKTQTYGYRTDNTASGTLVGNNFSGNLLAPYLDNTGLSKFLKRSIGKLP